eukprot:9482017-Pyramimonas_sp.AAC.2
MDSIRDSPRGLSCTPRVPAESRAARGRLRGRSQCSKSASCADGLLMLEWPLRHRRRGAGSASEWPQR